MWVRLGPALPYLAQLASEADPNTVWTPQQMVDFAVVQGPAAPPGQFCYSDTNYIILGMIAQAVTGEPIQELITQRILQPLHLSHTSFPTAAAPRTCGAGTAEARECEIRPRPRGSQTRLRCLQGWPTIDTDERSNDHRLFRRREDHDRRRACSPGPGSHQC